MRAASALLAAMLAAAPALAAPAMAEPPGPDTAGDWFTEDHRGVVHVAPCGPTAYCGTIVGVSDFLPDGAAVRDVHGKSQCQLLLINGMVMGKDGRRHGTVTDPTDGKTYDADLWVGEDGALRLRGYIGIELFGSTQRWEKFSGKLHPDCHFTPTK